MGPAKAYEFMLKDKSGDMVRGMLREQCGNTFKYYIERATKFLKSVWAS